VERIKITGSQDAHWLIDLKKNIRFKNFYLRF
jgi:hypothetical protein